MKVCVAIASVAILLFMAACRDNTPPRCDICATSAIIYGTVRRADGRPVPDVTITIEAHAQSCNGPRTPAAIRYARQMMARIVAPLSRSRVRFSRAPSFLGYHPRELDCAPRPILARR